MSKILTEKDRGRHRLGSMLLYIAPSGFLGGDDFACSFTATLGILCGVYAKVRLHMDNKRRDISNSYNSLFQNRKPLGSAELGVQTSELEKELE